MVQINSVGDDKFTLNNKTFARIFQPLAIGLEHVGIYNTYDTRLNISAARHYSEFVVNGTNYNSQTTLIQGLLNVIYVNKGSGTSGGGTWGSIIGTLSDQGDLMSAFNGKEPIFSKNSAFNKNFGSAAGTVAQGNDTRINNGQTAYGWGDHTQEGYSKQTLTEGSNITITGMMISATDTTYSVNSLAELKTGLLTIPMLQTAANLNAWLNDKSYLTTTGTAYNSDLLRGVHWGNVDTDIVSSANAVFSALAIGNVANKNRIDTNNTGTKFRFLGSINDYDTVGVGGISVGTGYAATLPPTNGAIFQGNVGIGKNTASEKLDVAGNIKATAFFESSDATLKTNVEYISPTFKKFELKEELGKTRYGVLAQEVETTNPELVRTGDDGLKSVNYTDLLCMKMAEMENEIERLEKMVNDLSNKIA